MGNKKVLMVVANNGFQDDEFGITYSVLYNFGCDICIVAGNKGECIGVFGKKIIAEFSIVDVDVSKFDLVVFVGGGGAYLQYFHDENYLNLAKNAKKIGAICIAPMIVSESGVFVGKTVTGRDQNGVQKSFIEKNGGIWSDGPVVICDNIVTGNGPDAAQEFGQKCVELIINY